ncbi:MAG: acetyl-CoA carboxylase biotin carboxyl carrier protein subunit [Deltaproteobacteria bacterium]|nr:acetyl-CoA carboxylase biotin carboxyl carrier protein subunit [Deltaproteobacteria bacterium]
MATYKVKAYGKEYVVEVIEQASGARVIVEGYSFEVEPAAAGSVPTQLHAGAAAAQRATAAPVPVVTARPAAAPTTPPARRRGAASAKPAAAGSAKHATAVVAHGAVLAPIPGVITKVCVALGEEVKAGQTVVKLEAMKMENDITSLIDGIVKELAVGEGTEVCDGQLLVLVE